MRLFILIRTGALFGTAYLANKVLDSLVTGITPETLLFLLMIMGFAALYLSEQNRPLDIQRDKVRNRASKIRSKLQEYLGVFEGKKRYLLDQLNPEKNKDLSNPEIALISKDIPSKTSSRIQHLIRQLDYIEATKLAQADELQLRELDIEFNIMERRLKDDIFPDLTKLDDAAEQFQITKAIKNLSGPSATNVSTAQGAQGTNTDYSLNSKTQRRGKT